MSGLSLRGCMQIVEEKAHSERALLLTVKELEARLAGLDSEKEAVISRSIVNLRYHHPLACMTTLSCGGVSDCSVSECVLTVCACVCMCVCVCVSRTLGCTPWVFTSTPYWARSYEEESAEKARELSQMSMKTSTLEESLQMVRCASPVTPAEPQC